MRYKLQVKRYERTFKRPLVTSRFILKERQGLIIRLENEEGSIGFGEIAPLEFFGTESLMEAIECCCKMEREFDEEGIELIDSKLVCCRFAFESAKETIRNNLKLDREFEVSALIDLNDENIEDLMGYSTFKSKIGRFDFKKEKEAFIKLKDRLPKGVSLRLDANGGLSRKDAQQWLALLEDYEVQFLEQPLAKGEEKLMQEMANDYRTAIALDESVVNVEDFERLSNDWKGWIVIKPALIGRIDRFIKLREECGKKIVYSSVFETGIGVNAVLKIAASDKENDYALGFGTKGYFFEDGFSLNTIGPKIRYCEDKKTDLERIWRLCKPL